MSHSIILCITGPELDYIIVVFECIVSVDSLFIEIASVGVSRGFVRLELDDSLEVMECLVLLVRGFVKHAPARTGVVRLELDGSVVIPGDLAVLTQHLVDETLL